MTLNGHYALHCTKHACFEAYNENLNEDRPTLSAAKLYPKTLVSFSRCKFCVEFCGYSRGFAGKGASNDSGVIENVDFQCFQALEIGQHYCTVLFSLLSPFH